MFVRAERTEVFPGPTTLRDTTVFLSSRRSHRHQPRRIRSSDEAARSVQSFASARVTATRSRRESSPPLSSPSSAAGSSPDSRRTAARPPLRRRWTAMTRR
ncbi:hypothetical protein F2Q70_00022027 [Brassica cretica]|nr:hypothetical protein F2Q70_00022027 [Brassica cretica]